MKTRDAIKHFGGGRAGRKALAVALRIRVESTYSWGPRVPDLRQLQIEDATGGKLRAEPRLRPQRAPQ